MRVLFTLIFLGGDVMEIHLCTQFAVLWANFHTLGIRCGAKAADEIR